MEPTNEVLHRDHAVCCVKIIDTLAADCTRLHEMFDALTAENRLLREMLEEMAGAVESLVSAANGTGAPGWRQDDLVAGTLCYAADQAERTLSRYTAMKEGKSDE